MAMRLGKNSSYFNHSYLSQKIKPTSEGDENHSKISFLESSKRHRKLPPHFFQNLPDVVSNISPPKPSPQNLEPYIAGTFCPVECPQLIKPPVGINGQRVRLQGKNNVTITNPNNGNFRNSSNLPYMCIV